MKSSLVYKMYRKIAKDIFFTFSTTIIITVLGFACSIVIARILGPSSQGLLKEVLTLPVLTYTFFNFGLESAIMYYGAKERNFSSINKVANQLWLCFSLVVAVIGLLFLIFGQGYYKDIPMVYISAILPLPIINFYMSVQTAILRAENDFLRYNRTMIIRQVAYTVVIAMLFVIPNVWVVIAAHYVLAFTGMVCCLGGVHHKDNCISRPYFKDMMRYGFKFYLSNVINYLNYRFDIILMTPTVNKSDVGVYTVAQAMSEMIWMIPNSVSTVLLPRLSSLELEEKRAVTLRVCRYVATAMLVLVVFAYLLADWIIPLIYSNRYLGSILPFKILLVGTLFMTYGKILVNAIASYGKPEKNLPAIIAGSLSNVVLNIYMIPAYGIIGAAISGAISYTILSIVTIVSFMKLNEGKVRIVDLLVMNRSDFSALASKVRQKLMRK